MEVGGREGTEEALGILGSPGAEKVLENAVQSLSCGFSEGETGEAKGTGLDGLVCTNFSCF